MAIFPLFCLHFFKIQTKFRVCIIHGLILYNGKGDKAFTVCHLEVILILNFTEVVYVGYVVY